jgi:hypothetical protein
MERLINVSEPEERIYLEREYNKAAECTPKHLPVSQRFLEQFTKDELFRASRRLTFFKDDRTAHYETNLAFHQRLESSCARALEVVSLVILSIVPEPLLGSGTQKDLKVY